MVIFDDLESPILRCQWGDGIHRSDLSLFVFLKAI